MHNSVYLDSLSTKEIISLRSNNCTTGGCVQIKIKKLLIEWAKLNVILRFSLTQESELLILTLRKVLSNVKLQIAIELILNKVPQSFFAYFFNQLFMSA